MKEVININNWETLTHFFPEGWNEKASELGALSRKRKFKSASDLLRVLLIHIATDSSLLETAVKSKYGNIVAVSDVAVLKRLKSSSNWFNWMTNQLLSKRGISLLPPDDFHEYNIRTIDASVVSEPGSTGTDWRLHYSMELFNLKCDHFKITSPKVGESLLNYNIKKNDLVLGDRAYGNHKGMSYVTNNDAFYLLRIKKGAFNIFDKNDKKIDLISHLRKLEVGQTLELVSFAGIANSEKLPIRILAVRKSDIVAEQSIKRARHERIRKQQKVYEETLEFHKYIVLVTNLPDNINANRILELYRLRWQIELSFKRLKSIFGLGHLPKKDPIAAMSWLQGKLFVAILAQIIIDESQFFSPWGYPIQNV